MDFQIVWSAQAVGELDEAIAYVAERNPQSAAALHVRILEHVETLARFPHIGPVYAPDQTGRARHIACRPYRILYRVDELVRRVEILTVWHGSRPDPDKPE